MTDIKGTRFERANEPAKRRLIMALDGREKSGKSDFALRDTPAPIAVINTDIGLDGVIQKFQDEKEIYKSDYIMDFPTSGDPNKIAEKANTVWTAAKRDYFGALENKQIRTLVVDTATELWELLRLARFGKLTQVMPHHYGTVNAEFRNLLDRAYDYDKNVLLLHKLKKEYKEGKDGKGNPTGRWERAGFGDTGHRVQVNARTWRDKDDGEFHLLIQDCRQNEALFNEDFTAPMNSFSFLASAVFPDTTPEEWI